jgi:malonate transporter MadM subunit
MELQNIAHDVLVKNGLLTGFACVGMTVWVAYFLSDKLTRGRIHGTAIAVLLGLVMAYIGGKITGGKKGITDIPIFAGLGLLGGTMLRDFAIVSTAFGVHLSELRRSGWAGVVSLILGLLISFISGVGAAVAFGYRDAVSITTIGAGAMTYIVGPVTGTALGASSQVCALSIAAGLIKAICVMIATPLMARRIGLDNPRSAMIFGGMMGTNVGVAAGLAATDPKLVPYGAMTATFYTGFGCLLAPSLFFFAVKLFAVG